MNIFYTEFHHLHEYLCLHFSVTRFLSTISTTISYGVLNAADVYWLIEYSIIRGNLLGLTCSMNYFTY